MPTDLQPFPPLVYLSTCFLFTIQKPRQLVQLRQLILRQRLGREQIQRSPAGIGQQAIQDGQVVAQSLAAGCRRDDGHMLAAQRERDRIGLMRVECGHTARGQRGNQAGIKLGRKWRIARGLGGRDLPPGDVVHESRFEAQRLQGSLDRHAAIIARMRRQRNCDGRVFRRPASTASRRLVRCDLNRLL